MDKKNNLINPVLAKLFRCAKLAENAGYGFDKMLKWEKTTHTKVVFENSVDISSVTFLFDTDIMENTTGIVLDGIIEKDTKKLTLIQESLLIEISKNEFIAIHELSKKTKINIRNIKANISKLKSKGLLIRIGPNKGGYWKVIK